MPNVPGDGQLPFTCRLWTRWSDEDNQHVLNNAVYLTLFEEARHRFFSGSDLLTDGSFPFLLAASHLRFLAPGRGGVEVTVRMGTTHIGRSSFEQAYRVFGPEGNAWCEGSALLVCYDAASGKSRPMDEVFRSGLERLAQG
ncbi:MAG: thioesterase family protein [Planctomycetota bacterium]